MNESSGRIRHGEIRRIRAGVTAVLAVVLLGAACSGTQRPIDAIPLSRQVILLTEYLDDSHMQFGKKSLAELQEMARVDVREIMINRQNREAIFAHPPLTMTCALDPEPGTRLKFGVGIDPAVWDAESADGVEFIVQARVEGSDTVATLWQRHVDPRNRAEDRRWIDDVVDLGQFAGKRIFLELVTMPVSNARHDWSAWCNPRLVGDFDESSIHPRGLLIITADTLRADHLGCYGNGAASSPFLDLMSRRGIQFDQAYSQFNTTNASHCSIMTSLYGPGHGVNNNNRPLDESRFTIAEVLSREGVYCGAVTSVSHLGPDQSGLGQGFQSFDYPDMERRAGESVQRAVDWLERNGDAPFFLWVHLFDPHILYDPEPHFVDDRSLVKCGNWPGRLQRDRALAEHFERTGTKLQPPDDTPFFINEAARRWLGEVHDPLQPGRAYLGEVMSLDLSVGRLLAHLRRLELVSDTVVVFVADHGESLGEHGIHFDHRGLYEVSLRIPLLLGLPLSEPQAMRIGELVETVDILPTCCQVLGFAPPEVIQGQSLIPLVEGTVPGGVRGTVFAEHADTLAYSATDGTWKLIQNLADQDMITASGGDELFNLVDDPAEETNVFREYPAEAARLSAALERWLALTTSDDLPDAPEVPLEEVERRREKLRALGYIE